MVAELSFWREHLRKPSLGLVAGALDRRRDTAGGAGHLTLRLPSAVTEALLTRVPARLHGGIQEVLLTAVAVAVVAWWRRQRGQDDGAGGLAGVLLDVEGHGREEVFGAVDLSRTVGWFTSLYPVRLDVSGQAVEEALAGGASLGGLFKSVKEQLRGLPRRGLGYGLLRYLNAETAGELAGLASPQLSFNYLGRFASGGERRLERGGRWRGAFGYRCGAAALACDCGRCDHAGRRAWQRACGELDVGAFADQRGAGAGAGGGLVRGAFGAGATRGTTGSGRAEPERPCAGCAVTELRSSGWSGPIRRSRTSCR